LTFILGKKYQKDLWICILYFKAIFSYNCGSHLWFMIYFKISYLSNITVAYGLINDMLTRDKIVRTFALHQTKHFFTTDPMLYIDWIVLTGLCCFDVEDMHYSVIKMPSQNRSLDWYILRILNSKVQKCQVITALLVMANSLLEITT